MEPEKKDIQKNEKGMKSEAKAENIDIEKLKTERDEYLAGWQRAKADFANAKKSMEQTMRDFRVLANERLIEDLLPTLQSFEMAFSNKEAWEKADKGWRSGVEHIHSMLKGVLSENGLKEISPLGQKFDPNLHEAVRYEHSNDKNLDHSVLEVVEKGYQLGGKLIKPAKVVVAESKGE